MTNRICADHVAIILKKPRYPENIGAAARAMCNMGFSRLIVVDPEDFDLSRIKKTATHESEEIVDAIQVVDSMDQAVESCNYVVGTTARLGKNRRKASTPSHVADHLVAVSRENHIGILFGPEDRGLANEDIALCDTLIHIPTFGFTSINLAQSVMIICYELSKTNASTQTSTPKRANKNELSDMYQMMTQVFDDLGYVNTQNPTQVINACKDFFSRVGLRSKDVIIIRTFLAKILHYGLTMFDKGYGKAKDE